MIIQYHGPVYTELQFLLRVLVLCVNNHYCVFQIAYAAVDCTKGQNHELCKQEGVEGYPTFNYYNYGKFNEKYNGERGVSVVIYHTSVVYLK